MPQAALKKAVPARCRMEWLVGGWLIMAAEGAMCGFLYLEGSSWGSPEDTEPLAPGTLGIPEGLGKTGVCVSGVV